MKKCVKCGHENLDEARFCAECGHELNSSSSNSKSNRNISFKRMKSNFKKHPYLHICCIFPLIFFAMFSIAHDAQGFYKEMHAEDYQTNYPEESNALDINEDGKLEFNEVNNIVLHTPQEKLYDIFKKSDKTGNGYLIGYEYDIYRSKATGNYYEAQYRKELEEKEKQANASKNYSSRYSSSSKHSNSLNDHEYDSGDGYVLTCPYCGSESVYETGGYYRCAECGNSIYSPDELELGYWDGYME